MDMDGGHRRYGVGSKWILMDVMKVIVDMDEGHSGYGCRSLKI